MLSPLQQRVARVVTALPAAEGFALAGGAALVLAEVVERETRDLDFFGATSAQVDQLVPELEAALRTDGLEVTVNHANSGFARFTITGEDGDTTELDLGVDARIRPAETGPLGLKGGGTAPSAVHASTPGPSSACGTSSTASTSTRPTSGRCR